MIGGVTLSMLRSFEAAARHGSLKAAADEIGLSPSAMSHAVRQLETALGTRLFDRGPKGLRLTLEGRALTARLATGFDEIRRGVADVGQRGSTLLRLHAAPSFAALWLLPRLGDFAAQHPRVDLRLVADTDYARFAPDDFDLDIVYGPIRAAGVVAIPLGEEEVTPLCSPALAARIGAPADLATLPLIQSEQKQVRWDDWSRASGVVLPEQRPLRFDRSFLALSAAASGLGVALESTRLAGCDLAAGRLVAPLAVADGALRYVGHALVLPRARPLRSPVRAFARWLLRALDLPDDPLPG